MQKVRLGNHGAVRAKKHFAKMAGKAGVELMRALVIVLTSLVLAYSPAQALEMSIRGDSVFLSGAVISGDDIKFKELLAGRPAGSVKNVWLNSPGSTIFPHNDPAGQLGRIIRANGLTTIVDAAKSRCETSCTVIFVSGVRRIYLNAAGINEQEGGSKLGLGIWEPIYRARDGRLLHLCAYLAEITMQMIQDYTKGLFV